MGCRDSDDLFELLPSMGNEEEAWEIQEAQNQLQSGQLGLKADGEVRTVAMSRLRDCKCSVVGALTCTRPDGSGIAVLRCAGQTQATLAFA